MLTDMDNQKNMHEKLFDELVSVRLMYNNKLKKWNQLSGNSLVKPVPGDELKELKRRIDEIEQRISGYGESFLDVYDSELGIWLSEPDIITLREELREVRDSLKEIVR